VSIRDKIVKAELHNESVDVPGWNVKIEVRARTVKQQYDLLEKARKPDGEIDGMLLAVETILACSFDPDTGEKVFDPADRDTLLNADASAFNVLLAASNRAAGLEDIEDVEARLKGTAPDDNSSS
jgi:hypothetical protein